MTPAPPRAPHLGDFGVARLFDPGDDSGAAPDAKERGAVTDAKGTHAFMAPECLSGEEYSAYQADVWAMGITLYALLTGRLPYCEDSEADTMDAIESKPCGPRVAGGKVLLPTHPTCSANSHAVPADQCALARSPIGRRKGPAGASARQGPVYPHWRSRALRAQAAAAGPGRSTLMPHRVVRAPRSPILGCARGGWTLCRSQTPVQWTAL